MTKVFNFITRVVLCCEILSMILLLFMSHNSQGPFLACGISGFAVSGMMFVVCALFLKPMHCASANSLSAPVKNSSIEKDASSALLSTTQTAQINLKCTGGNNSSGSNVLTKVEVSEQTNGAVKSSDRCNVVKNNTLEEKNQKKKNYNNNNNNNSGSIWILLKCLLLFVANMLTYFIVKGVQDWTGLLFYCLFYIFISALLLFFYCFVVMCILFYFLRIVP